MGKDTSDVMLFLLFSQIAPQLPENTYIVRRVQFHTSQIKSLIVVFADEGFESRLYFLITVQNICTVM
jgi:hypothetical protein